MPIPDLADTAIFPGFVDCPIEEASEPTPAEATSWLLAQVKNNMTIMKPTLVATDRHGEDFALTFEDRGVDLKPFKKGTTLVLPGPRRTRPEEGKKGFVRVPAGHGDGGATAVPGSLEVVGRVLRARAAAEAADRPGDVCDACEATEGVKKCTGCGRAQYCGKVGLFYLLYIVPGPGGERLVC